MRRTIGFVAALLIAVALAGEAGAQFGGDARAPVVVTPDSERSYRIALQRFADVSTSPRASRSVDFRAALADALEFSSVFAVIDEKAFLGPEVTGSLEGGPPVVCSDWTQIGADGLVQGEVAVVEGRLGVAVRVWDAVRCKDVIRRRYSQEASKNPAIVARRVADDIVEAFVGVRGVSGTEIAFVSDRGGNKEIYVANADGSDARAATANRSINNFPSWSSDGDSIAYTSYRFENRPLLFLSSRGRRRPGRLLTGNDRAQYRGVFGPSGRTLALVVSTGTAPDLFLSRDDGTNLRRLTRTRSIEVSPTWSPDGERLAFVSDRTGSPHVYMMHRDGSNVKRLTFDGSYNTSPSWSPDGRWIAYETRVGGQFDIWLIDPDGSVNVPLITHPRSDEGPAWAPDSRKLVFSSTRRGRADLYVVDLDGSNLRRLTQGAGNNTSPAWGPYPK
jgi:TolB protein